MLVVLQKILHFAFLAHRNDETNNTLPLHISMLAIEDAETAWKFEVVFCSFSDVLVLIADFLVSAFEGVVQQVGVEQVVVVESHWLEDTVEVAQENNSQDNYDYDYEHSEIINWIGAITNVN